MKTKKNRYIPCSVTVTTLHRQLASGAAASATRAYASWKVRARSSRALLARSGKKKIAQKRLPELSVCTRAHAQGLSLEQVLLDVIELDSPSIVEQLCRALRSCRACIGDAHDDEELIVQSVRGMKTISRRALLLD